MPIQPEDDKSEDRRPLVLPVKAIAYALHVASSAGRLVNAIIDKRPLAGLVRSIIEDLGELEAHIIGDPEDIADRLREHRWASAALRPPEHGEQKIELTEEEDSPSETRSNTF